jgi:hypothetical protein
MLQGGVRLSVGNVLLFLVPFFTVHVVTLTESVANYKREIFVLRNFSLHGQSLLVPASTTLLWGNFH